MSTGQRALAVIKPPLDFLCSDRLDLVLSIGLVLVRAAALSGFPAPLHEAVWVRVHQAATPCPLPIRRIIKGALFWDFFPPIDILDQSFAAGGKVNFNKYPSRCLLVLKRPDPFPCVITEFIASSGSSPLGEKASSSTACQLFPGFYSH